MCTPVREVYVTNLKPGFYEAGVVFADGKSESATYPTWTHALEAFAEMQKKYIYEEDNG